jgi:hypothetical protein
MEIRNLLHEELVNLYNEKNVSYRDIYKEKFAGVKIDESNIGEFTAFLIKADEHAQINEGIGSFIKGLFTNMPDNVGEQVKEWAIAKILDTLAKPVLTKFLKMGDSSYMELRDYLKVTFAEIPLGQLVQVVRSCDKMVSLLLGGVMEYVIKKAIDATGFTGVFADNIRQQLDKSLVEGSPMFNQFADSIKASVCNFTDNVSDYMSGKAENAMDFMSNMADEASDFMGGDNEGETLKGLAS